MPVSVPALKSASPAAASRLYYGWIVLIVAAAAMVGTLPGRTQGLGLITESLLADLGLSRVRYAELNLWATLLGAAGAIGIGQLIDRLRQSVRIDVRVARPWPDRVRDEPDPLGHGTGCLAHVDARLRTERLVCCEPRHRRPVVRARDRFSDGRVQHRHERRVHARLSTCWVRGSAAGVACSLARRRRDTPCRARAARVGGRPSRSRGVRTRAGRRRATAAASRDLHRRPDGLCLDRGNADPGFLGVRGRNVAVRAGRVWNRTVQRVHSCAARFWSGDLLPITHRHRDRPGSSATSPADGSPHEWPWDDSWLCRCSC